MAAASAEGKSVRIQPPRRAKVQLGKLTKWLPEEVEGLGAEKERPSVKGEDTWWQVERIKRYGFLFNDAIKMWQGSSKEIRQFFIDGKLPDRYWEIEVVEEYSIPKNRVMTLKSVQEVVLTTTDIDTPLEKLERLAAFWKVMNSNTLPTFGNDAVLFRGVKYDTYDQLLGQGFVVDNILTNWTSSQKVAGQFMDKSLFQCQFPKGSRYLFTGHGEHDEHEYIIPGGRFQVAKTPYIAKFPSSFPGGANRFVRLVPLSYDAKDQTFAWPGKSTSPSTRKNYQQSIDLVLRTRFSELWRENRDIKSFESAKTEISNLAKTYGYEIKINFEPLKGFYQDPFDFNESWKSATSPPPPPATVKAPAATIISPTVDTSKPSAPAPPTISISTPGISVATSPGNGAVAMTLNGGYSKSSRVLNRNLIRTSPTFYFY